MTTRLRVEAESAYDVVIGSGAVADVASLVPTRARRVAVIHPSSVAQQAADVMEALAGAQRDPVPVLVPDSESAKSLAVAGACWDALGDAGISRSDAIVSVGGGSTTDLAGFVASTWMRGLPVVHVPTTLLAMVDAAVGGKTGINSSHGKNLIGTIHEPAGVVCDLDTLATLPTPDLAAGLAEVVKCGFIADPQILGIVAEQSAEALDPSAPVLEELVARSVAVKAAVVAGDLRESVTTTLGREVLNYGHTLGHAIERVEGYRWRHGDAISVGMVFVAELARIAGRLDPDVVALHRRLLGGLGLPTTYAGASFDSLLEAMRLDKKSRGDLLRFIVLDGIAEPGVLEGPSMELLQSAFAEVSA